MKTIHSILILFFITAAALPLHAQDTDILPAADKYADTESGDEESPAEPETEPVKPAKEKQLPLKRHDDASDSTFGLRFGMESMSRSAAICGGSYLYSDFLVLLDDYISFTCRYSYSLVPDTGKDQLISTGLIFTTGEYADNVAVSFTPYAMINPDRFTKKAWSDADRHIAGRLCLFSGSDKDDSFIFDFLPFTVLYNYQQKKWSWAFELFSFGFKF